MILGVAETIKVVGVGHGGQQALELVGKLKPDLVLMDLKMPVMNGIHATRARQGTAAAREACQPVFQQSSRSL